MSSKRIVTLIGKGTGHFLTPQIVEPIANELAAGEVEWLHDKIACEILLSNTMEDELVRNTVLQNLTGSKTDFTVTSASDRKKRLLIADMDSTMIDQECIDELADFAGLKDKVSQITARAMNGELEFESALHARVALLKGLPISVVNEVIAEKITLAKGGKTLIATMKKQGAFCALVSGGFTVFTEVIGKMLGFDTHRSNQLEVDQGVLTGKVIPPILGSSAKVAALHEFADAQNVATDNAVAVGDGANDLPMLQLAGLGIALHAKPSVAQAARHRIDHCDLTSLLYIQGYRNDEIVWCDD